MAPRTALALVLWSLSFSVTGCSCRGEALVGTGEETPPKMPPIKAVVGPVDAGIVILQPASGWCASDCDCPGGSTCVAGNGELSNNSCQAGTNTCVVGCAITCGSGTQCVAGICSVTPCTGANCPSSFPISVAGNYDTTYQFDIHDFASKVGQIGKLIALLSAAFNGTATCGAQTTPGDKLMCIVATLIAQNVHVPPWVQSLLTVLSDLFKFGSQPVAAKGVMQLAESPNGTLTASETWSELWITYNGQHLNVMNAPTLGSAGQIAVTVKAFGGTRTLTDVNLGPRDIEFDVNKLIVNLINVAIQAASNNQAKDIEELLKLALCAQIPITNSNFLTCQAAATAFASQLELESGLGGIHLSQQSAPIIDVAPQNGIADSLGNATQTGTAKGDISNGLVSGALGPHPASFWYGIRK